MIYILNSGETVKLNQNDVKAAKKLVSKFVESVKKSSVLNERPTLYIIFLPVKYIGKLIVVIAFRVIGVEI